MSFRLLRISLLTALLAVATLAVVRGGAPGAPAAVTPLRRVIPRYRAVILATPGYSQAMAFAAGSRFWVGSALPLGHRGFGRAVLGWLGGRKLVSLQPVGFLWSLAAGTDGVAVVGGGQRANGSGGALLWSGTPLKAVVLAPAGSQYSMALAVAGGQEVGYVVTRKRGAKHAALWCGGGGHVVDLNPKGFLSSVATGTDGKNQVGWGFRSGGQPQAIFWSGTSSSAVDINPRGFTASKAYGIWGGHVVGEGVTKAGLVHALLWVGASHRVVDLNPPGYWKSICYAVGGGCEVGITIRRKGEMCHAVVWHKSAASAVGLQVALPRIYRGSQASAVGPGGKVFGFAIDPVAKRDAAVEWVLKREVPSGPGRPGAAASGVRGKREMKRLAGGPATGK